MQEIDENLGVCREVNKSRLTALHLVEVAVQNHCYAQADKLVIKLMHDVMDC